MQFSRSMSLRRSGLLVFLMTACLAAVGCGSRATTAPVEGNVSVEGKPVTGGLIRFFASDGRSVGGYIDATGHFTLADVPIGENKVTIATSHLKSSGRVNRPAAEMNKFSSVPDNAIVSPESAPTVYVAIDASYESVDTTKLTATVKSGDNQLDFSL